MISSYIKKIFHKHNESEFRERLEGGCVICMCRRDHLFTMDLYDVLGIRGRVTLKSHADCIIDYRKQYPYLLSEDDSAGLLYKLNAIFVDNKILKPYK